MSADNAELSDLATTGADYEVAYYEDPHLAGYADYGWESEEWRQFFTGLAERFVAMFEPRTSLDVGCAKGLLVQALAAAGVDARGFDLSEFAVSSAHPDVRDRLSVRSATDPIEGRYDLVTCIEVLEHMSASDAQKAIDAMCAVTDRIVFSSTPGHFDEATHINVHPTSHWAAWFAERGFYRRTDVDLGFLTAWSVVFERDDLSKRAIVERYEAQFAPLNAELLEKRKALLEVRRELTEASAGRRSVALDDDALLARHAEMTALDHVLGLEATVARLEQDLANAKARIKRSRTRAEKAEAELKAVRSSRTWRVGRLFTAPLRRGR